MSKVWKLFLPTYALFLTILMAPQSFFVFILIIFLLAMVQWIVLFGKFALISFTNLRFFD